MATAQINLHASLSCPEMPAPASADVTRSTDTVGAANVDGRASLQYRTLIEKSHRCISFVGAARNSFSER